LFGSLKRLFLARDRRIASSRETARSWAKQRAGKNSRSTAIRENVFTGDLQKGT